MKMRAFPSGLARISRVAVRESTAEFARSGHGGLGHRLTGHQHHLTIYHDHALHNSPLLWMELS